VIRCQSNVLYGRELTGCLSVLDLARLISGFCSDVVDSTGSRESFFNALFKASDWSDDWAMPLPKAKEINTLLLLRTLANAFQGKAKINEGDWALTVPSRSNAALDVELTGLS
jgi:hypothetical protein